MIRTKSGHYNLTEYGGKLNEDGAFVISNFKKFIKDFEDELCKRICEECIRK